MLRDLLNIDKKQRFYLMMLSFYATLLYAVGWVIVSAMGTVPDGYGVIGTSVVIPGWTDILLFPACLNIFLLVWWKVSDADEYGINGVIGIICFVLGFLLGQGAETLGWLAYMIGVGAGLSSYLSDLDIGETGWTFYLLVVFGALGMGFGIGFLNIFVILIAIGAMGDLSMRFLRLVIPPVIAFHQRLRERYLLEE